MFITLTINVNGSIGGQADLKRADINLDHVLKITRDESNNGKGSKITYTGGVTDRVIESIELIEKLRNNEQVGAYRDPTEPQPKNA